MGRGGKKKPVLETGGQITDGLGDLRIDGVPLARRWCGMVRFVEDEERPWKKSPQPVAESSGVRIVDEQAMRDQQPRVGSPRINAKAALAANFRHVLAIQNFKAKPELWWTLFLVVDQFDPLPFFWTKKDPFLR